MKALFRILLGGLVLMAAACTPKDTFWLGADISGSAGQEARGENYYDADGRKTGWSMDSLFGGENIRMDDNPFKADITDGFDDLHFDE